MKITRYPQSCILIEKDDQKIVIDPGDDFLNTHQADELKGVAAVLYTHQHPDHYEPSIAKLIGDTRCTVVEDGAQLSIAHMQVVAQELAHCPAADGSPGPQNTAYIIDGILLHPGDAKNTEGRDIQASNMALPITGPDISMRDAFDFAKQVGSRLVIPIHYDRIPADPEVVAEYAVRSSMPFEMRVLADGESLEIS